MFFMNKRGMAEESTTTAAAGFILLIALFLVAYLILLPESAREDVLEGEEIDFNDFVDGDDNDDNGNGEVDEKTLLLRNPGKVLPSEEDEVEKDFASINLFATTDSEVRKIADSISVSRSAFSNGFRDVSFNVDNVGNLKSMKLFFNIKEAKGDLIIYLNGRVVFEGSVSVNDLPIEIPVQNLRERNTLRFEASRVGFAFLSSNRYVLRDVQIVKEFSLENKRELRTFEVSRAESIDDAVLEFFVNCLEINREQGILKIFLNRKNAFFGKVVCDASQSRFEIDEDDFIDGTNFLTFEVDKGNYIIEQITLSYDFDEGFNPLYFFTVDEDDFDDIEDKDAKVVLNMRFDNDKDRKRADIRINSKTFFMDVNAGKFEKDITGAIEEGENFIKIFAKNEFDIVQLEILLKDI